MLKINKYFAKKFQKLDKLFHNGNKNYTEAQEILLSCGDYLPIPTFNFERKILGLESKMKRLMLSLKMKVRNPGQPEAGKRKAYTHLLNESVKLLATHEAQIGTSKDIKSQYGGELGSSHQLK